MRARYLHEFQSINIDNLNGDKYRTGKTTPEGLPDPSAFSTPQNREGIQVGTAITTLLRTSTASTPQQIQLRDLWGTQKLSKLDSEARRETEPTYNAVSPIPALGLPFAERAHSAAYTMWPKLPELFGLAAPGVKTSRDALVTDIDSDRLEAKMKAFLDSTVSAEQLERIIPSVMEGTGGFNGAETRELLQNRSIRSYRNEVTEEIRAEFRKYALRRWQIQRFTYRPFDIRWIYWEPETDLIDRKREELMIEVIQTSDHHTYNLFLEARQRENSDKFCRGAIASSLPDNFGSGLSTFFPLFRLAQVTYRLDAGGMGEPQITYVANQSVKAMNYMFRLESDGRTWPVWPKDIRPDTYVFFHALATMHTPLYRAENSGALLGDWPRIPLPATAELLTHSATLGRQLADLLDPESSIQLQAEWSFLARLSIAAEYPEGTPDRDQRNAARFALTAGWGGAGQGATVMPRRGDARERDWTETELAHLASLTAARSITGSSELALDDVLSLLGSRCVDVYLNAGSYWAAIPLNVWNYTLGGYQVLKKWLSYRELPLLGRPLHEDEARYFAQVVRRIAAILLLGPALDASYAAILPTATGLPDQ